MLPSLLGAPPPPLPPQQSHSPQPQHAQLQSGPLPQQANLQQQGQLQQGGPSQQGQGQQQQAPPHPPPPPNGQDMTLAGVLHFLQTEWRRYERDRNEWEIERAELRARVALLEGERRSFDNIKIDLTRRIKMLEYALRVERSKQLNQPAPPPPTSTKASSLISPTSAGHGAKDEAHPHKEGSGDSSPRSDDMALPNPLTNGIIPASISPSAPIPASTSGSAPPPSTTPARPHTWAGGPNGIVPPPPGPGKPPPGRDPKSRARSREYLKQCLQEVNYLTAPGTVNPLPNRPLLSTNANPNAVQMQGPPLMLPNLPNFAGNQAGPSEQPAPQPMFNGRPRKVVPEVGKDFPNLNGVPDSSTGADKSKEESLRTVEEERSESGDSHASSLDADVPLTAIFRPDDAGEWKERLRAANEEAVMKAVKAAKEDDELHQQKDDDDELEDESSEAGVEGEGGGKIWKAKRTLRNHLDAVRTVSFHSNDMSLATGGDDCTIKLWRVDIASLAGSSARPTTEIEPQLTLRGHAAPITRLVHSSAKRLLYSASLDSTIRVWGLPPPSHTTYAAFDASRSRGIMVGHTDAIWDLALVRDESLLVSCGAEGAVKVWDVNGNGALKLSWGYGGVGVENHSVVGATAVEGIKTDLRSVAVAYRDAVVKIFDLETGKETARLRSDVSYDGTPATQINAIVSHPTMPLIATAHEDKYIRIFDTSTGQCTHAMLAHLDAVTSLSIDASGFSLVSGGHDCSVRFWDILNTQACVQEVTSHRKKGGEGVLDVAYHPTLPFLASAGADGVVKLYGSS